MKTSKVNWAKCPHCGTIMNGYQFYPANVLMENPSNIYTEYTCPGRKCGKKVGVSCKVEVTFKYINLEDDASRDENNGAKFNQCDNDNGPCACGSWHKERTDDE